MTNMTNVTADGRYVCTLLFEDLSDKFGVDLLHGYVGFEEYWAARPLSRIVRVDTGSGAAETVFEEEYWIGHTNTSPTLPNLLTFCHEGPWHRVDNRIWGLDLDSGRAWKIRPGPEGEAVGHEYWLADGIRIGYHGYRSGRRALLREHPPRQHGQGGSPLPPRFHALPQQRPLPDRRRR